jgi:hypothetical protein
MKKKFTLICLLISLLFISEVYAQIPYTFSQSGTTYSSVTGGTDAFTTPWDDDNKYVPLGFSFSYLGKSYTHVLIHSNGALFFDVDLTGPLANYIPVIMIFGDYGLGGLGADLIDRGLGSTISQSPVVYKTEGTVPNRVFRVEWQNAGFYLDTTNSSFVNVQGKLYEGTNKIEVIIGPNSVASGLYEIGSTGPVIGLGIYDMTNINNMQYGPTYFLTGPANSPTAVNSYSDLNGTPANGTVYNFTSGGTGISEIKNSNINIYPNPVVDNLVIALQPEIKFHEMIILDAKGRAISSLRIETAGNLIKMDMSHLLPGFYTLLLKGSESTAVAKFVK